MNGLHLLLFTLFMAQLSAQVLAADSLRNPSALWPKECSSTIDLEELKTSSFTTDPLESSEWQQNSDKPSFIAVVTHGLNLRPSKMNAYIKFLNDHGGKTLRVALEGHRGSLEEQKQVTWTKWLDQYHDHYCLASKEADRLKVPLINLSFSLGALVSLGHMAHQERNPYQKIILIAPAAWVHWFGEIPQWFTFLGPEIGIPSKNLKAYRSQKTTSLAAYEAMGQGRKDVQEIPNKILEKKTFIIIDPEDELVSVKKIQTFIEERKLNKYWSILKVSNINSDLKKSFHHLIVDELSLGKNQWKKVLESLSAFLKEEKTTPHN